MEHALPNRFVKSSGCAADIWPFRALPIHIGEDTMDHLSEFCTCRDTACPLHPSRHGKGCAPCINKNLKAKEIPSCFFRLLDSGYSKGEYSFEAFARLVLGDPQK